MGFTCINEVNTTNGIGCSAEVHHPTIYKLIIVVGIGKQEAIHIRPPVSCVTEGSPWKLNNATYFEIKVPSSHFFIKSLKSVERLNIFQPVFDCYSFTFTGQTQPW